MQQLLRHYRDVRYICGDYMTVDVFPVFTKPGKKRKRGKPSSEIQKKLNQRHAEERFFRLVHANFTHEDVALHLTYDIVPLSMDAAKKDIQNFFRRIKYARMKAGLPELKYVYKTEISKTGRIHHHIIMSGGLSRDLIEEKWGKGYANSKRLRFTESGVKGLTVYMLKGDETYRRWTPSKNLVDPAPLSRDYKIGKKDVEQLMELDTVVASAEKLYEGWEFVEGDTERNNVNAGVYVKLLMRRKDPEISKQGAYARLGLLQ